MRTPAILPVYADDRLLLCVYRHRHGHTDRYADTDTDTDTDTNTRTDTDTKGQQHTVSSTVTIPTESRYYAALQ